MIIYKLCKNYLMNKTLMPALLVATIMVAGAFAFAPVEQASTVHLTGTTVASGITPTTTNPVNIATAAGSANVITVGNVAQVDTFVVAADTTLTGILTVTPTTTDAINIATAAGAANVVTVGNVAQADTFVVNADTTLTGIANIVPTTTDAVNIAAVAGSINAITIGNPAQADTIALNGATTSGTVAADTFNWASAGGDTYNVGTGVGIDTINIGTEATAVDLIKIGDSTAKIGFFGNTPVDRPANYTVAPDGCDRGGNAGNAAENVKLIDCMLLDLKELGLITTS
jgi:hypothetical protein